VAFERIHPFRDGNGRVGRIIMNAQRLQAGLPILIIPASERRLYYEWFRGGNDA
jgi:Fic family protein